jgi:hypothetical protein
VHGALPWNATSAPTSAANSIGGVSGLAPGCATITLCGLLRPVPSVDSVDSEPDAEVIAMPSIMRMAPKRLDSSFSIAVRLVASVYGWTITWNQRSPMAAMRLVSVGFVAPLASCTIVSPTPAGSSSPSR